MGGSAARTGAKARRPVVRLHAHKRKTRSDDRPKSEGAVTPSVTRERGRERVSFPCARARRRRREPHPNPKGCRSFSVNGPRRTRDEEGERSGAPRFGGVLGVVALESSRQRRLLQQGYTYRSGEAYSGGSLL